MRTTFLVSVVWGCLCGASPVSYAQSTWRTDSLMASWPVQHQLDDLRNGSGRGVVRAVDTRDLYTRLKKVAPGIPVFADFRAYDAVPHGSGSYAGSLGYARSDANARRRIAPSDG